MSKKMWGPCHRAAMEYLDLGWNALAVCPPNHVGVGVQHRKACSSPGKVPLNVWKRLQEHKQQRWWLESEFEHHPQANVGVVLGPVSGGLVAVDVDGPQASVVSLLHDLAGGNLPQTLSFRSHRGFRLLYLAPDNGLGNCKVTRGEGRIEVMAKGMFTVMPPSVHESGDFYRWVVSPEKLWPPAQAPKWLYELRRRRVGGAQTNTREYQEEAAPIVQGSRNAHLFRLGCALRRHGATREELLTCLAIFNQRCEPPLEGGEMTSIASKVAKYKPYVEKTA